VSGVADAVLVDGAVAVVIEAVAASLRHRSTVGGVVLAGAPGVGSLWRGRCVGGLRRGCVGSERRASVLGRLAVGARNATSGQGSGAASAECDDGGDGKAATDESDSETSRGRDPD
jgi:hypothetical protein